MKKPGTYLPLWALLPLVFLAACGGKRLSTVGLPAPSLDARPDGVGDAGPPDGFTPSGVGIDPIECAGASCNASISDLCCPPSCSGATDIDCAGCGNGRLESGEICDPLETCPTSCPQLKCEKQRLKSGGTCADVCVSAGTQTVCVDGDECCPAGCTAVNDRDCTSSCGNGTIEPGELCDPLASCPQSCPMQGCTILAMKGAGTCLARCEESGQQSACAPDDGCCPAGCTATTDSDCAVQCGNSAIEGKETCDPLASCPKECPAQGCRLRRLVNDGTCTAACIDNGLETQCKNADGCCPVGCNGTNDSDCPVLCGNSVVEAGETCDPIASCLEKERACVSDGMTTRVRSGDSGKCTFECMESVRTCGPADGACPPGCGPTMDRDCRGCGNGVLEAGETCDPVAKCSEQAAACVSDNTTVRTPGGDPAACTFTCTATPRACGPVDAACPAGCTPDRDPDCLGCGNGRLDPGETCDPVADCQARAKACVSDATTIRTPQGDPATCRFVCQETPRTCGPMDGVCPANCGPTQDRDCPGCGNLRVEAGETCDPCAPADVRACVSDDDTIRMPSGQAAACTFLCTATPRPCAADGICPKMCTPTNDVDCRPGPGQACTPSPGCRNDLACTDGRCCTQTCKDCQACTGSGGTCVNIAKGQPDNVPAGTCVAPSSCDGAGQCLQPCQLIAKPPSHDFGTVTLGSAAGMRFAFANGCTMPVQPTITISPADYSLVFNGCTAPLAVGANCNVSVQFKPTTTGSRPGTLTAAVAGGGTTAVPLMGVGAAAPPAMLRFSPDLIEFKPVPAGGTSAATATLTNAATGGPTGPLTITSNQPEFTVVAPFCPSLEPGASCAVQLRFSASKPGGYKATLSAKAAAGGTALVGMTATATNPSTLSITPEKHDFGFSSDPNNAQNPKAFTVNSSVPFLGALTATTSNPDFAVIRSSCGNGTPCTVVVQFKPASARTVSNGILTVTSTTDKAAASAQATLVGNNLF